jgi:hypothetical protein
MSARLRGLLVGLLALAAAGCASVPAPKYAPGIHNTELLYGQPVKIAVGPFTAAPGVANRSLTVRASQLTGGGDGMFSTYLRDAAITELKAAARYDADGPVLLTGVLTRNEISTGLPRGTATLGADFVLTRGQTRCYDKTLVIQHHWDSSFVGAVAIPAAINNYPTAVQDLLGKLFSDPAFLAALAPHPVSR